MNSTQTLIMGTRGSALALAQARQFAAQLEFFHPGLRVEERIIRTTGDKNQSASLPSIGGKGVFTLEIERALLEGDISFRRSFAQRFAARDAAPAFASPVSPPANRPPIA